jgi:transcriptional regulator with XRE-family HTH domain
MLPPEDGLESHMDSIVGRRIRQERERLGVSQDQLASMVGLGNRSQVHKVEAGDRRVDSMELRRFADALGVSMDALFDQARGEIIVHSRGGDDRMTQWGLDLLADMQYAADQVESRGW